MKWCAVNESVEPAAAVVMTIGQKAPHFDMHDSGHGRKSNVFHFNYTIPPIEYEDGFSNKTIQSECVDRFCFDETKIKHVVMS